MFSIRDKNPHFLPPLVTYALIGLNVAVWVWIQGLGSEESRGRSVCTLGLVPGELLGRVAPGTAFPMGLAAAGLQMATQPSSIVPMVGASGAIGGVMGAYVVLSPRVRVHLLLVLGFYVSTVAVPAIFMLGYWFLVQGIGGAASFGRAGGGGVAFWAHVGGFVAGAVLVLLLEKPALVSRHPYHGSRPASGSASRIPPR